MTSQAAQRVFAGELNRSTRFQERKGEMSLLIPTGVWCTRVVMVGALTEVQVQGKRVRRARIADPTGVVDLLPPRSGPAAEALAHCEPPVFVAIIGTVRQFGGRDQSRVAIEPDHISVQGRDVRDSWVLYTAEQTLQRMERMKRALAGGEEDPGLQAAIQVYGTTMDDLRALANQVRSALETVKEDPSEPAPIDPREVLLSLLAPAGTAPMAVEEIYRAAAARGIGQEVARAVLQELLAEGECYSPRNGYIRLL